MKDKTKRNYGIDLLRITAMFMIVIIHIISHGGVFDGGGSPLKRSFVWMLYLSSLCAVNCYALISGYVGINSKYKYTNIAVLWLRVVFYSVIIIFLFWFIKNRDISIKYWLMAILPASMNTYWYFTAYMGLYILIPVINSGVKNMAKMQIEILIFFMVFVFSVMPAILRTDPYKISNGYSSLWLIIMYIIGAYIKRYKPFSEVKQSVFLLIYIIAIFITLIFKILIGYFESSNVLFKGLSYMFVSYTSPTMIIAACSLVLFFKNINLSNNQTIRRVISFITPMTFSVYLIHDNPLIRANIIVGRFKRFVDYSIPVMIIAILCTALSIFAICIMIDCIRNLIFKKIKISDRFNALELRIINSNSENEQN